MDMPTLHFSARDRAVLLWALSGCLVGPVAFAILAATMGALLNLATGQATVDAPLEAIAGIWFVSIWGLIVASFASPVVAPLLVVWVAVAKVFPWIETRRGITSAGAAMATSAALLIGASYASMTPPFGARGWALFGIVFSILVPAWLGLVLPRLFIPALRPGVFAPSAIADAPLAATSAQ